MTFEQLLTFGPFIAWATLVIFFAGGLWFTVWQMRKDLMAMKPLLEQILPLKERVEAHTGELEVLRDDLRGVAQTAQNALLASAHIQAGD